MKMLRARVILLAGLLTGLIIVQARGTQIVLTPSKDATLIETSAAAQAAAGAQTSFYAGETSSSGARRGLLAFDIPGNIPAGATITSVSLQLTVTAAASGNEQYALHRVLTNWGEGPNVGNQGQGESASAGSATWQSTFFNSSTWTTPGGDFNSSVSGSQTLAGGGPYSFSSAGMITDVQNWLDSSTGNFGWLLVGDETGRNAKQFASRENATASSRPQLTVNFTTTPEPSAASILAVAAAGLLRRRR